MNCVFADYASNFCVIGKPHTGVVISSLTEHLFYDVPSKSQDTLKSSTFESKFVALRVAMELIQDLRLIVECVILSWRKDE